MSEEAKEMQNEELEVLQSIYEGDTAFTMVETPAGQNRVMQYKYGEDGSSKSFILSLEWTPEYPNEAPKLSMDAFYNKHVLQCVKDLVLARVTDEIEQYLGMSMTYSLFQFVQENVDEYLEKQPDVMNEVTEDLKTTTLEDETQEAKDRPKKEQLTKAQKRRMWDKGGLAGEDRPRGWDWVDVIRHLSQTGGKDS